MTWADLVAKTAAACGVTRDDADVMICVAFEVIGAAAARGERAPIPSFGVFTRRRRKARAIAHPITGERLELPAQVTIGFRAARDLKHKVTRGRR